jgi:hypothetical protein
MRITRSALKKATNSKQPKSNKTIVLYIVLFFKDAHRLICMPLRVFSSMLFRVSIFFALACLLFRSFYLSFGVGFGLFFKLTDTINSNFVFMSMHSVLDLLFPARFCFQHSIFSILLLPFLSWSFQMDVCTVDGLSRSE